MSNCAKCGRYFETSKQTNYCSECERPKISTCDMPLPGFGKQDGWICPVCGRGLSPWTSFCPCQGSEMKITYGTSTGTNMDPSVYKEYQDILDRANKALDIGEIKRFVGE